MTGRVTGGPYVGQKYHAGSDSQQFLPPRWRTVVLTDENGLSAIRDVPEKYLNAESAQDN